MSFLISLETILAQNRVMRLHLASGPLPSIQKETEPNYNQFIGGMTLNYLECGGHENIIIFNMVIMEALWIQCIGMPVLCGCFQVPCNTCALSKGSLAFTLGIIGIDFKDSSKESIRIQGFSTNFY